eukprot:TRINITY_DN7129_c0_g1_i3.p2 TRINITY_DN7129_c0_g1~~TRINITY_DN7129_c0_g1_i3.p2  ORF type:complete len:117 (-),score=49.81 TRINITY_DN7129_c0_g1_i3:175-525(-)
MLFCFFFFFSSRRRHTRCREVSWARRCVQETALYERVLEAQRIAGAEMKTDKKKKKYKLGEKAEDPDEEIPDTNVGLSGKRPLHGSFARKKTFKRHKGAQLCIQVKGFLYLSLIHI